MSTTSVETTQTAVDTGSHKTSENFTSELITFVKGYTKDELAKPEADRKLKPVPESDELDEQIEKGEFVEVARQTYRAYFPSNIVGVQELVPDDDEVVNLVYNSLKTKLNNAARSNLMTKDFAPSDSVTDLFDVCGRKSERRLSAYEKTEREILENFTPEMQAKLLALLQKQVPATT